jgi:guanylate kinase
MRWLLPTPRVVLWRTLTVVQSRAKFSGSMFCYLGKPGQFRVEPMADTGACPLVLCGPSGSGKSTVMKKLMAAYGEFFGFSVSHTTRNPRPGEEDGKDYHYVTKEKMQELIDNKEFIENATFSGNMYGTSKKAVQDVLDSGKICILDIDVQGVKLVKKTDLKPRFVFIKPPSMEVLEKRLRDRGTENEESLAKRLGAAAAEMEYGEEKGNFDVIIINDDLETAYENLRDFIMPDIEKLKKSKK